MKVDTHKSVGVYFFRSKIREKGGIGMGKKGTPHRKWSKEEKLYYIHLHLDEHLSVMEIERRHGVRNSLVSAWVKRYLEEGEDALEPKNGNPYAALHTSKTLSEVDRLRLIIAKQEVEIARLKKDIGWKELVQRRNTLLAAERIRSHRRTERKISGQFSVPGYGCESLWLLQMAAAARKNEPL